MNTVELQINTYRESTEYGKPFGFLVFDSRGNRHQYGLHQWASVCSWNIRQSVREWVKREAIKAGACRRENRGIK